MMIYDVVIVGGGPAGLQCARILGGTGLQVLLLEKKQVFGDKLCAGGITMKDMDVLPVPKEVIGQEIGRAIIHSRKRQTKTKEREAFLFTVDRKELGAWQASLLQEENLQVRTGAQVTGIGDGFLELKDGEKVGFRKLVGADGYASMVRRYLGLDVRKKLIGFQYTLHRKKVEPVLKMYLDASRFGSWYAWSFPHRNSIAVGCCCDPSKTDHLKVRDKFISWVRMKGFDPGDAPLESYPIACDYRGVAFGHIYLVGEAAGLASLFTGEGIYQSLVSGEEVARIILDPEHDPVALKSVVRYNRNLERVLGIFRFAGPLRGLLQEFLVFMMGRKWIRDGVNRSFS